MTRVHEQRDESGEAQAEVDDPSRLYQVPVGGTLARYALSGAIQAVSGQWVGFSRESSKAVAPLTGRRVAPMLCVVSDGGTSRVSHPDASS